MRVACINCFNVRLRDKHSSVKLRALGSEMLAYQILRRTKYLIEYVYYDALARIETGVLIKLMGRTGRAQSIGWSRDEVMGRETFLYDICIMCDRPA
jgi:hypothetical protein